MRGDVETLVCWHPACPGTLSPPPLGATAMGGGPSCPDTHTHACAEVHTRVCTRTPHARGTRVCWHAPTHANACANTHARTHTCTLPGTRTSPCAHTRKRARPQAHSCTHGGTRAHTYARVHTRARMYANTRAWTQARKNAQAHAHNPMHARANVLRHTWAQAGACTTCVLSRAYTYILEHICREAHTRAHPCAHIHVGTYTRMHTRAQPFPRLLVKKYPGR